MKKQLLLLIIPILIGISSSFYILNEGEQAIILKFGDPISDKPIVDAGLHFKLPIMNTVIKFDKRILETKKAAIANNVKLAKEHGNKLTQNIDKEGNLYGVNNTIENNLKDKEDLTSADIRKELFQGENIITKSRNNKFDPKKHMKK